MISKSFLTANKMLLSSQSHHHLLPLAQACRPFSHPVWNRKTKWHFKPDYYDNINFNRKKRWDVTRRKHRLNTQDPLFFDYDHEYLNRGIQPYIDRLKSSGQTDIPVNKRAYLLYHMGKAHAHEPELVLQLETNLSLYRPPGMDKLPGEQHITARYAMGAVTGYWRMNTGTAAVLKYWEHHMVTQAQDLHIFDVIELCRAFKENRTHHRDHWRGMLTKYFKKNMIENLWA